MNFKFKEKKMNQTKRLIFKLRGLEKYIENKSFLKVSKLEVHPGTIYGVVGTVGSGKTTLLNILSGVESQTKGAMLYDDSPFDKNWYGKIIPSDDVYYSKNNSIRKTKLRVSSYIGKIFHKKKNTIKKRYFNEGSFKNIWSRKINELSPGEFNWLGTILACEEDPRVLLIDDYGMFFSSNMEKDFRNKILKMNRTLGTTIILSAPSDHSLKHFASVLVYLDHGHISKIRPGVSRKPNRNNRSKKPSRYNRNSQNNRKVTDKKK
jgi:ABC-type multidrug transport system ATPase subunit